MGHALAFAAYLRHIGAPVDRYFQRQGLPALCEDADVFVPLHRAWAFFDAATRTDERMLGWYVGRFVGDHNLNRGLLKKLERAPTLFQALRELIRMSRAEASHVHVGIHRRREDVVFSTNYPDMKGVPGYASSQAYQLGIFCDLVRHFTGSHWFPPEIGIEYPVIPTIAKELFPDSRILAGQRVGYITIPRSCLHVARPRGDSEADGEGSLTPVGRFTYGDTLSALLKPYLSHGYPSARLAASLMGTSLRTLHRKLSASGLSYQTVVDELRFGTARDLLENTDAKVIDVAGAVGFDDQSHFSRMFRRIAGLSPREFRKSNF